MLEESNEYLLRTGTVYIIPHIFESCDSNSTVFQLESEKQSKKQFKRF